jgi:hypothetical protein
VIGFYHQEAETRTESERVLLLRKFTQRRKGSLRSHLVISRKLFEVPLFAEKIQLTGSASRFFASFAPLRETFVK